MNPNITRLAKVAGKKSRLVIGLMSGTSLDGLDVALCRISGSGFSTKVDVLNFQSVPYNSEVQSRILEVFARKQINFQSLCELNAYLALLHGDIILQCLKLWKVNPEKIDLIASHGQTVFHSPKSITPHAKINSTLQVGDGDGKFPR